jgi:hypothetical protein
MNPQRPKISRKPIVLLVSLCLILAAVLIPVGAHLPRWVEIEIVLGVWWLIWVIALTWILHRGHKVEDDANWTGMGSKKGSFLDRFMPNSDKYSGCGDFAGCADPGCGEGFGGIVVAILALILIGLAVILLVELIIPAIALLLFASIGGMFARAVNDTHDCEGSIGKSLFWGALWATVYIGPVAAVAIWLANYLAHRVA